MIYDVFYVRNKSVPRKTEKDAVRVEADDVPQAMEYCKMALLERGIKKVHIEGTRLLREIDLMNSTEPIWKCPEKKITLRHKNKPKLKRMLTKLVIEVRGGNIVFIGSNTENVEIKIIDHDNDDQELSPYQPDSVMTNEGLDEYFNKTANHEGLDETDDNTQVLTIYKDKNGKEIKKGDRVLVPDPNDTDVHNHEFEGTVHSFRDVYVIVQDMEENGFSIEPERLEILED